MDQKTKQEIVAVLRKQGRGDLVKMMTAQSKEAKRAAEDEVLPIIGNVMGKAFREAEKELLRIRDMKWKNLGEENSVMRHRPMKVMPEDFANDVAYAAFQILNNAKGLLKLK